MDRQPSFNSAASMLKHHTDDPSKASNKTILTVPPPTLTPNSRSAEPTVSDCERGCGGYTSSPRSRRSRGTSDSCLPGSRTAQARFMGCIAVTVLVGVPAAVVVGPVVGTRSVTHSSSAAVTHSTYANETALTLTSDGYEQQAESASIPNVTCLPSVSAPGCGPTVRQTVAAATDAPQVDNVAIDD